MKKESKIIGYSPQEKDRIIKESENSFKKWWEMGFSLAMIEEIMSQIQEIIEENLESK